MFSTIFPITNIAMQYLYMEFSTNFHQRKTDVGTEIELQRPSSFILNFVDKQLDVTFWWILFLGLWSKSNQWIESLGKF